MSRFFGLILIPQDTPRDEIFEVVYETLTEFAYNEDDEDQEYHFDYFVELDDYPPEEVGQIVFTLAELSEQFATLQVEAIITPDGAWHDSPEDGWADPNWHNQAQTLFTQFPNIIGVKFLYHT